MKSHTQQKEFLYFRSKIDEYNVLEKKYKEENKTDELKELYIKRDKLMREKTDHLYTLFQPEQRSAEWYEVRETIFTASSDVSAILGISDYSTNIDDVVLKKCGVVLQPFTGNKYTWHGQKYEEIASDIYCSRFNTTSVYNLSWCITRWYNS
jgi:hypothetical protein